MALTDKDIVITPNRGQSADPKIDFVGASSTLGPQTISLNVYPTSNGTLSFEGLAGQLFSVTNSLTGTIYSVNDVSGIPSIEVLDTGLVKLAQYSGNILIGTSTDDGSKLQVRGSLRTGNNGWNSSPASTTFSHTIAANAGTNRTVNFDGNGTLPSIWWTNGSRPYGAIDAQDPGLTFWAHNGSDWQKQITLNYGSVVFETTLQNQGYQVLHANNYNSYSPTLTGGGASGTWGINITGNAATATSATDATKLPLTGGTLTGDLQINSDWGGSYNEQFIIYGTYPSMTFRSTTSDSGWLVHTQSDGGLTYYSIAGATTNNWTQRMTLMTNGELRKGGSAGNLYIHDGNYNSYAPTLTGTGASGTWAISITGNAATITNQANSATITASTGINGNEIVRRSAEGYIYANHVNFNTSVENPSIANFITDNGDGWSRKSSLDHVKNSIRGVADGTWAISITGNADTVDGVHASSFLRSAGHPGYGDWNTFGNTLQTVHEIYQENFNAGSNTGSSNFPTSRSYSYGTLINFAAATARAQVYISHAGNDLIFRGGWGDSGWTTWNKVLTDQNYNSYALPLSGGTLTGSLTLGRDLIINGNTGGNYGNRLIIGNTDTSYTIQDSNLRPTLQLHGQYPVVSLNHTITNNINHGPTLQFTNNGTGHQFVIGTNGTGTMLSMGYSNNANWNPHNGIAGYEGTSFFQAGTDGYIGIGSEGDWSLSGGSGTHVPAYNLHFIGSNNAIGGHAAFFDNRVNATNSGSGFLFRNLYGNHSWGIVAEYRVENTNGNDRPSILFSNGYNNTTWSVGFGFYDDDFRIKQNHGHRNSGWGTERFRISNGGMVFINGNVAIDAGNYNSYSPTLTGTGASGTWAISITGNAVTATTASALNTSNGYTGTQFTASSVDGYFYANRSTTAYQAGIQFQTAGTTNWWNYLDNNTNTLAWYQSGSSSQVMTLTQAGTLNVVGNITVNSNQVLHAGNYTSYRGTQLVSPNGAAVVAADSAMPDSGHSFIHTLALGPSGNDGHILGMTWASTTTVYGAQIWIDTDPNNRMAFRSRSNVGVWTGWNEVLNSSNYNSYSPTLTGGGASGTWGINITGNAGGAWQLNTDTGSKANALQYWQLSGNSTLNPTTDWHYAFRMSHGDAETYYSATIALNFFNDTLSFRRKVSGTDQSWRTVLHDGNYNSYALPLTGGTMTGIITTVSQGTAINFSGQSDSFGYNGNSGLGTYIKGTGATYVYGGGSFFDGSAQRVILHANNYSSYALPLSGGTITGTLTTSGAITSGTSTLTGGGQLTLNGSYGVVTIIPAASSNPTYFRGSGGGFYFQSSAAGNTTWLSIDNSGNGTFLGNVTAVDFISTSDARLKTNIEPIRNAVETIKQIQGHTYTLKQDPTRTRSGVLAQELAKVLPGAVTGDEDTQYSVSYNDIIAFLVEAVKEQQQQIDELKRLLA